jgi:P450-derived glycosyltransferase activator
VVTQGLSFAFGLYRQRIDVLRAGYLQGDPLALLQLRPGRDDPYAIYSRLRAAGPIVRSRTGMWVTTTHRACKAVLSDRHFGVNPPGGHDFSLLEKNPPEHTRLRRLVQPAFGPKQVATHRPLIEHKIEKLLADAETAGRFDLMSAFAEPVPIAVISELLGVRDADVDEFSRHGAVIAGALDGVRSMTHAIRLRRAHAYLTALFERLFELRRREPADDVISRLVAAEGDQVQPAEMLPLATLLLVAGFETVVNLIGNAVSALLDHPEQWNALCTDPGRLAPQVVEETLRYDPPVQRTVRMVLETTEVEGVVLRSGEFVVPLIGAANRDPQAHPDPDFFDIFRVQTSDHLGFSSGVHYCIGKPLAVLEATAALQALAERMPGLRRAGEIRRRNSQILRGPVSLPVHVPRL